MPRFIENATIIEAAGNEPKGIPIPEDRRAE